MPISEILNRAGDLPLTTILLVIASTLFAVLIFQQFRSWRRLRHIPGPFWNGFSILPFIALSSRYDTAYRQLDLQRKYGPLFRIGPNHVMYGDADTIRKLGSVRSSFTKGPFYGIGKYSKQDNVLSMLDEAKHKSLKAKLSPGFSSKGGVGFEPKVDQILGELIHLINTKYISTPTEYHPLDFAHAAMFFVLDVVSEVGWSEALGYVRNDKDMHRYIELNDTMLPILSPIVPIVWVLPIISTWPLSKLQPGEGDDVGFGKLMDFAREVVAKRLVPGAEEPNDVLQAHIRNGVKRDELAIEMCLEIMAGSDTTANSIRLTLLALLTTPSALSRLQSEITHAISHNLISSPISNSEALSLPYLQAVIYEGIRLYPPTNSTFDKQVPPGGVTLHNYYLPEGTQLLNNTIHMMHSTEIFGPDADLFRPERWIDMAESDPTRHKEWIGIVDLVFGYGKYVCLGKALAMMELNKVFVELLRRYEFAIVTPHQPMVLRDCTLWLINDFHLRVTKKDG